MKRCPKCGKQFPDEANFCPADAGRLVPDQAAPAQPEPAVAAAAADDYLGGRFKLGNRIGGSVTGEVYEAFERGTNNPCVVKLIAPEVFPTNLLLQRSERELKQLEHVDASGIAQVLGYGRRGEQLWVATERVGGGALDQLVAAQGALDLERASGMILAIGRALGEAGKVGVVHRDLAPKNIIVDGGDIKLINFGVPVPASARAQGVPEFISPEQVEGKLVDQRSNIYSLGAIYYYLLTGRPPYVGEPEAVYNQHLDGNPPAPPSAFVPVSPKVDALIIKALERISSKRFMTLRQFLDEVERGVFAESADGPGTTQRMGGAGGKLKKKELSGTLMGGYAVVDDGKATDAMDSLPAADQAPMTLPMDAPAAPETPPVAHAGGNLAPPMDQAPSPHSNPAYQPPTSGAAFDPAVTTPFSKPPVDPGPAPGASSQPAPYGGAPAAAEPAPAAGFAPAAAPPVAAVEPASAPVVAPPVAAVEPASAPVVAPPVAAPTPAPAPAPASDSPGSTTASGKRRKGGSSKQRKAKNKGKFRETMWFKKGALDAEAATKAAEPSQAQGLPVSDKADEMPIEDRYEDDGSIDASDKHQFSLQTGHTQSMKAMDGMVPDAAPASDVSEDELISEMKGGRGKIIALIVVGLVLVAALVIYFMTSGGDSKKPAGDEAAAKPATPVKPVVPPPPPPDGSSGLAALTTACQAKDGEAVWKLLGPELVKQADAEAAKLRKLKATKLKKDYKYTGKPAALTGAVYITTMMAKGSPATPCKGVDKWTPKVVGMVDGLWVVGVDLGDGTTRELKFAEQGESWSLAQMTAPAKPAAEAP